MNVESLNAKAFGIAAEPSSAGAFRLFPDAASQEAHQIDVLFWALLLLCAFIMAILFVLMGVFLIRYRAGSNADRSGPITKTWKYEMTWIGAAFVIGLVLFAWGGYVYIQLNRPPADATTYYVVGRQWMWDIQHPNGTRELNALHVPADQPIKLVLTSEDVIHSFYVPAFRTKRDAVPGRYTTAWFTPTKPGEYELFCAEYCGTDHARMTGTITVMKRSAYQQWLEQQPPPPTAQPLDDSSELSFRKLGCEQCHVPGSDARAPRLEGLFGRTVTLRDGSTVLADEQYIRESIINPAAEVVQGYQPIMPTYKGMLTEQQIAQLVQAIRSLSDTNESEGGNE